jgi:hypothetical protein
VGQVISNGGVDEYEAVLKLFRQSDFSEEQRRCLQAFGAARTPELLVRTLDFALSEEVRTSDVPFPVGSVSSNPVGTPQPLSSWSWSWSSASA